MIREGLCELQILVHVSILLTSTHSLLEVTSLLFRHAPRLFSHLDLDFYFLREKVIA
jgi:hypothetical protein